MKSINRTKTKKAAATALSKKNKSLKRIYTKLITGVIVIVAAVYLSYQGYILVKVFVR
jgi:hypothetical protein